MSFDPTLSVPAPTAAERAARDAYLQELLMEGIEAGASRLRVMHRQCAEQEAADEAGRFAADYDLITRSMRRAVMLVRRLDEPEAVRAERCRVVARRQVIRAVEDRIAADADAEQVEALHAEMLDRLDAPEFEDDLAELKVPEVVATLCRDLGLGDVEGLRRTPEAVATLYARARAPAGALPRGAFAPVVAEAGALGEPWRKPADQYGRRWRGSRGPTVRPTSRAPEPEQTDAELAAILAQADEQARWEQRRVRRESG